MLRHPGVFKIFALGFKYLHGKLGFNIMGNLIAPEILCGLNSDHISVFNGARVHREVIAPLQCLGEAAARAGFNLTVASAFRDFPSQLRIWNEKAAGVRPLLDAYGKPINFATLNPEEIFYAILKWSALPGTSRHHWGTDLDVYDANALAENQKIQLVPQEIAPGGSMELFSGWLGQHGPRLGFYRPYDLDRGGVRPEWWHISYRPLSDEYTAALSPSLVRECLRDKDIELKEIIIRHLDFVFERYVKNIS
jgi:LAS superfamily LD-carboxypeptidase LdcB